MLLLTGVLLAGCDSHRVPARKVSSVSPDNNIKPVVTMASHKLNDIEKMERCRRELEALKRIDIRESTQDAVDAYCRYRVDKMCADISKNVLDSLSDKGK